MRERSFHTWVPGRVAVVAAIVAAVLLAFVLAPYSGLPRTPPTAAERVRARYTELARADPALVAGIVDRSDLGFGLGFGANHRGGYRLFEERMLALGPRARPAILRWRLDQALGAAERKEYRNSTSVTVIVRSRSSWWGPESDLSDADAWFLHRNPNATCDAVLARWLGDNDLPFNLRLLAMIALSRPGNAAGADALAAVVLDDANPANVREHALLRVPRCGTTPRSLRALLTRPWDGLDRLAALTLAAAGDVEAPSHVLAELRDVAAETDLSSMHRATRSRLAIDGVVHAVGSDASLRAAASRARELHLPGPGIDAKQRAPAAQAFRDLADTFADWLDGHPEAMQTAFERRRATYLASDRRRRELKLDSFEAIAAANPATLDVGAGAITLAAPERREELLAALDLLAWELEDEIRRAPTARTKLDVLNRHLLRRDRPTSYDARETSLDDVLRRREGNCVGWSTLYVALGERLGLPLRAVSVPGHMFVRWDDGSVRVNVDPVNEGASWDDAKYAEDFGVKAATPSAEGFLRNLTPAETLAIVSSNLAAHALESWYPEDAVLWADRALALDPTFGAARWNRFVALASVAFPERRAVVAAIRAAQDGAGSSEPDDTVAAKILVGAGCIDEAVRIMEPLAESPRKAYVRAAAAIASGDLRGARAAARAMDLDLSSRNESHAVRLAANWLERASSDAPPSAEVRNALVDLLLFAAAGRPGAAKHALDLLEADRDAVTRTIDSWNVLIGNRAPCTFLPEIAAARRWYVSEMRARNLLGDEDGIHALRALVDPPPKPTREKR